MDIASEAKKAFEMLPEWKQKYIGPDAPAILRTAQNFRTGDGLVDGAIDRALHEHKITSRSHKAQQAYREYLTNAFLFGDEAVQMRKQKRMEGGAREAQT